MTLSSSPRPFARRSAVVAILCLLALVAVAVPAGAAKPVGGGKPPSPAPTAPSMTIGPSAWANNNTCAFDATYTWSGIKGRGYNLTVQLRDSTGALLTNTPQVSSVPSNGSFTFIFTFTGAPGPSRQIYARGVLLSNGSEVVGTAASSPLLATTCGSPISVGWVQSIVLS